LTRNPRVHKTLRVSELADGTMAALAMLPHGIDAVQDAQKRRLRRLRGGLGPAGGKGEGVCMAYPQRFDFIAAPTDPLHLFMLVKDLRAAAGR